MDFDFNSLKATEKRQSDSTDSAIKKKKKVKLQNEEKEEDAELQSKLQQKKKGKYGIWVGNLNFKTTRQQLHQFFSVCGEITRLHVPMKQNMNQGFAYIDFECEQAMKKAILLSEQVLQGRQLLIKDAKDYQTSGKPRGTKKNNDQVAAEVVEKSSKLFIGNLSFDTQKEDLIQLLEPFGPLLFVRVGQFEDTGRCKGFAHVTFEHLKDAEKVMEAQTQKVLKIKGKIPRIEYGQQPRPAPKSKSKQQEPTVQNQKIIFED